jgi:hypothetical protein
MFLDLESGQVIKRKRFDELPMPDSIIKKLDRWGRRDKQNGKLTFADRNNNPFGWDDEYELKPLIEDNALEPEPTAPFPDIPAELPGVDLEANVPAVVDPDPVPPDANDREAAACAAALENANFGPREQALLDNVRLAGVNAPPPPPMQPVYNIHHNYNVIPHEEGEIEEGEEGEAIEDRADQDEVANDDEDPPDLVNNPDSSDDEDYSDEEQEEDTELDDDFVEEEEALEDAPVRTRSGRESRMPSRFADNYTLLAAADPEMTLLVREDEIPYLGVVLLQMSLKQGLRVWGEKGEKSAMKEMKQLHDMDTFIPRDPKSLTREERAKALASLIFLKEKANGDITSRTCVNGAPQWAYIRKEDASSPTVMTDSVFIVGAADAFEGRATAACDLPGAFLHTISDEKVIMVLRDELCDLMVKVNPQLYRKYVSRNRKGRPILYVELYKSMYGLMRSTLLFYRKLKGELLDYGFVMNPYDPCVANKVTKDGSQLTVIWHVDDVKMSCKNSLEVTKLLLHLKRIYGSGITIHRGPKFNYLGMELDYSEKGVFGVSMVKYTTQVQVIDEFPEEITKTSSCPHNEHLFKIRDESEAKFLPEEQAVQFHHTVAQLVFLQKRARRDIQTATSFLSSRVKQPDEDDWGKLRRVIQYLKATRSLRLRITVESLKEISWFIDGSHNVHWDCKGQSGGAMTLGKGAVISSSTKHKTNSKSACESELISVDDNISTVLWSLYFMQEQGLEVERARIFQDNKSTILLENNGKMSSSKRTKHIKAKFFFITDKIQQGDVVVEWLPTDKMWIDVNTKPKTGAGYRKDRAMLMNCPEIVPDETMEGVTGGVSDAPKDPVKIRVGKPTDRLQECVGGASYMGRPNRPAKLQVEREKARQFRNPWSGHPAWLANSQPVLYHTIYIAVQ